MDKKFSFEEIFKQNEKRIHYHIHKLHIRDPHNEFYVEGLYAMWLAYKKYEPDKGPMATYFNFVIRNRLIDLIRSKNREQEKQEAYIHQEKINLHDGNQISSAANSYFSPIFTTEGITINDQSLWSEVKKALTKNQWKWVDYHIIQGMSYKEIAEKEQVSIDAVKSWGREARRKLRRKVEMLRGGCL